MTVKAILRGIIKMRQGVSEKVIVLNNGLRIQARACFNAENERISISLHPTASSDKYIMRKTVPLYDDKAIEVALNAIMERAKEMMYGMGTTEPVYVVHGVCNIPLEPVSRILLVTSSNIEAMDYIYGLSEEDVPSIFNENFSGPNVDVTVDGDAVYITCEETGQMANFYIRRIDAVFRAGK